VTRLADYRLTPPDDPRPLSAEALQDWRELQEAAMRVLHEPLLTAPQSDVSYFGGEP
jgi:hypothetical protein